MWRVFGCRLTDCCSYLKGSLCLALFLRSGCGCSTRRVLLTHVFGVGYLVRVRRSWLLALILCSRLCLVGGGLDLSLILIFPFSFSRSISKVRCLFVSHFTWISLWLQGRCIRVERGIISLSSWHLSVNQRIKGRGTDSSNHTLVSAGLMHLRCRRRVSRMEYLRLSSECRSRRGILLKRGHI